MAERYQHSVGWKQQPKLRYLIISSLAASGLPRLEWIFNGQFTKKILTRKCLIVFERR